MSIIKKSPSKYVHSTGMLQQLDQYLQGMGKILLILISESWPRSGLCWNNFLPVRIISFGMRFFRENALSPKLTA